MGTRGKKTENCSIPKDTKNQHPTNDVTHAEVTHRKSWLRINVLVGVKTLKMGFASVIVPLMVYPKKPIRDLHIQVHVRMSSYLFVKN